MTSDLGITYRVLYKTSSDVEEQKQIQNNLDAFDGTGWVSERYGHDIHAPERVCGYISETVTIHKYSSSNYNHRIM
jgi:hypothetical protein